MAVTAAQVKKVVKVASGIIYSQEGNYGSVNRNDNNHGMSIGKCQWNAYWGRALPLLKSIVEKDQEQAKEILGDACIQRLPEVVRMRGTDRREKQPKRKPMQYLSCSQPRTERKYRTI